MNELGPQLHSDDWPYRVASPWPGTAIQPAPRGYQPLDTHNALSGRDLRYVLTSYIEQGYRTVKELAHQLADDGYTVWGRASKVISDALRWEVRNGRVVRIRRGVYRVGKIPRSTRHRILTRVRHLFFAPHVVASRRDTSATGARTPHKSADRYWREWTKSGSPRPPWSMRWTHPGAADSINA